MKGNSEMLVAKLIKPCKICIYDMNEDGGELESFSLLKLSLQEYTSIVFKAVQLNKGIEYPLDGSIVIPYSGNDELHQLWKKLATEHMKQSPKDFIDVSAEFKTNVLGTSCLIRDPTKHIIRIAKRNGDDKVTINRLCISNDVRERFFNDVKRTKRFTKTGKYAMDTQDLDVYTYWSKFMNSSFIIQLKDLKNSVNTKNFED